MRGTNSSFSFQTVRKENTAKLITNLDNKKAVQSMDIPTKLAACFQVLSLPILTNEQINVLI